MVKGSCRYYILQGSPKQSSSRHVNTSIPFFNLSASFFACISICSGVALLLHALSDMNLLSTHLNRPLAAYWMMENHTSCSLTGMFEWVRSADGMRMVDEDGKSMISSRSFNTSCPPVFQLKDPIGVMEHHPWAKLAVSTWG